MEMPLVAIKNILVKNNLTQFLNPFKMHIVIE